MSIADSLIAGESIAFESKKHWMAPIRASLVAIAMLVGAWLIWWLFPNFDGFLSFVGTLADLISIGLVIGGIGWIIYNIVTWRTAEFAVTNMRVLREEGLISRRSSTTLLSSLSDVRSRVGFIGGKIGYGDIIILTQSGGAGEDRFLCITTPEAFRNAVMTQKMGGDGTGTGGTPVAAATPAPAAAPAPAAPPVPAAPVTSASDDAATLKKLADLRDSGAITPEEYEAKKTEILARM